jgi:hypothetical protein
MISIEKAKLSTVAEFPQGGAVAAASGNRKGNPRSRERVSRDWPL